MKLKFFSVLIMYFVFLGLMKINVSAEDVTNIEPIHMYGYGSNSENVAYLYVAEEKSDKGFFIFCRDQSQYYYVQDIPFKFFKGDTGVSGPYESPQNVTYGDSVQKDLSNFTFYHAQVGGLWNGVQNYQDLCSPIYYDNLYAFYEDMEKYKSYDEWLSVVAPSESPVEKVTLPNLTYKISKKWAPRLSSFMQYNMYANWDFTEHDIYKQAPENYFVECKAKIVNITGVDPPPNSSQMILVDKQPIVQNEISFSTYDVCDKVMQYAGGLGITGIGNKVTIPFYVYYRVITEDGSQYSDWRSFLVDLNSGCLISDEGTITEDDNGNLIIKEPPVPDSPNIDNSNLSKDPNGNNTSASRNPDSTVYINSSNVDASSLVSTLKSAVTSITQISGFLSICYDWLPSWLLSLISCCIGIIVVVGTLKIIRG